MNLDRIVSSALDAWRAPSRADAASGSGEIVPDQAVLAALIATSFEASLLREENRALTFRLIVRSPDKFPEAAGPPEGLHRLVFDETRPFTAQELRRLTPAVDHDRSLVGVCIENGELRIWGIVQSGWRWLEQFYGGRGNASTLPECLILGVTDPGCLILCQGSRPLWALEAGALLDNHLNVFTSEWLSERFVPLRDELMRLHTAERAEGGQHWATIDADFARMVTHQMIQRLISTIQRTKHGGTLLIVAGDCPHDLARRAAWLKLKFEFQDEEPRARFRSLLARAMNTLAAAGAHPQGAATAVGWDEYASAAGRDFSDLDEAIFETSHMLATLTAVDGAVVMTQRFDVLGFGGEITGSLAEVPFVARALDVEGTTYSVEPTDEMGMRHRSVYRLCNVLRDALGIVVSQDGRARFVRWNNSQIMYWNHSTITPLTF